MRSYHSTSLAIAVCVFLFWAISLHRLSLATPELCRELSFVDVYKDKYFNKSIIRNVTVQDEDVCQWKCFLDDTCKSYNLGPPQVGEEGKRVCELSSSHHILLPECLMSRPGFIYRSSVSSCGVACPEKRSCLSVDSTATYSCLCADPGFTGNTCTEDIDECAANTHDCATEANCTNTAGSFICTCVDGYQGSGKTCQDKDECSSGEHNCNSVEACVNKIGSFTCSCSAEEIQDGDTCIGFPFHWTFDRTDRLLNLRGNAKFDGQDGVTVLYLDGDRSTYAETPAIPIHKTDLTIAVWIKVLTLSSNFRPIYADWSATPSFAFGITSSKVCAAAMATDGGSLFMKVCTGSSDAITVERGKWIHVAMTWKRENSGKLKMYLNGYKKFEHVVDGNRNLDFKSSGRSTFDIGVKKDTGGTIHAYLSDLVIFNRRVPEHELKEKWVRSHALYQLI